jgi:hypothetical protein
MSLKYWKNISILLNIKLTAIPASSMVRLSVFFEIREKPYTKNIAKKAPEKAPIAIPEIPRNAALKPNKIVSAAPHEAPLATPKVNGSARGFLNIA